jgi:hypothetical protein
MSAKKRDYAREVSLRPKSYNKDKAARARVRYAMLKKLTAKYGAEEAKRMMEGKDVDHIKPISQGGDGDSLKNVRLLDRSANRADKKMFKGKRTTRPKGGGRK